MGATYYSYLEVAAEITEADIIETVIDTVVVCAHPHNAKFCPECGTKATDREKHEERKQFTQPFQHLATRLDDEDEPSLYLVLVEWDGDVGIGDLKLVRHATSSYGNDTAPLALALPLSELGGYRNSGIGDLLPSTLTSAVDRFRKTLQKHGFDKFEPRIVHRMYVSV